MQQGDEWIAQVKADPEVGGARFDESQKLAVKGADYLGQAFRQEVNDLGIGANPVLFKALVKIGKELAEDTVQTPQSGPASKAAVDAERDALYQMYPEMAKQLKGK